ncbi:hypothetical protein E4T42_05617 [Aureobasidium subglaciale]|nr:hypothetical protein E4T42_05617 [Aureobasidium subglaciale]
MQRPLLFLLACNMVVGFPLHLPVFGGQQYQLYDAESVELLLTASDDDELTHIWLPLKQRIFTQLIREYAGDYPVLPLHPTSVGISNVHGLSTKFLPWHKREQVVCRTTVKADVKSQVPIEGVSNPESLQEDGEVQFRERDGVVRLDEVDSVWYLAGREVESYECFQTT